MADATLIITIVGKSLAPNDINDPLALKKEWQFVPRNYDGLFKASTLLARSFV